jgi:hypothetical protein
MINLIPSYDMNFKEKLMAIANLILFISFIATLIFRNISFLLLGLIIDLFLYYVYLHYNETTTKLREKMDIESIDRIDNNYCIRPNKENPFMNPNIINHNNNIKACNIDNKKIKKLIDQYFSDPVYKDVNDIYNINYSKRQFYTMPSTTIPNDQEGFSHWLYHRPKTCKENNGEQCFNNIM